MKLYKQLRKKGHRITSQRKSVIDNIGNRPVSAKEIFHLLKSRKIKIDLASIYRSLDFFTKTGILQEINFGDGKKRYEKVEKNIHHHHLICENCGAVEDIPLKETLLLKAIKNQSKFKVTKHSIEFFGLCVTCQ